MVQINGHGCGSATSGLATISTPPDTAMSNQLPHTPSGMQFNFAPSNPVYVVCPRRKAGQDILRPSGSPVEVTLQLLRPYFDKPLNDVAEELGLSATAIKKACRKFGIPKWPYRTLTAKSSRNRAAVQMMTQRVDECVGVSMPTFHMPAMQPAAPAMQPAAPAMQPAPLAMHQAAQCVQQQPASAQIAEPVQHFNVNFVAHAPACSHSEEAAQPSPVSIDDDGYDEFSRSSSTVTDLTDESECFDAFQRAMSSPLETLESLEEGKEVCVVRGAESELALSLTADLFEASPLDGFDSELFCLNTAL